MIHDNVLDTIGNTPIVKLNTIGKDLDPTIAVKLEYFNPGGSVKDRIGIAMLEKAEEEGKIEPGGTVIEGTSGNTGTGLALVASLKGYRTIFTIQDKQSREKIDLMKAFGAEVIVCPTAVEPDDPRSYYSVAQKLSEEIPNSFYPNQYENPANPQVHYETTGPEIWEQTDQEVTHFVAGMGTGGTISGVGKYLHEQDDDLEVIGVDPVGSVYHDYFYEGEMPEPETYFTEGIGEDMIPGTIDFDQINEVVQVNDQEAYQMTRRLAREEAIFGGESSGAAVAGALKAAEHGSEDDLFVVVLPDTGHRNLGKVYNEEWMRENQFLEPSIEMKAGELAAQKPADVRGLITVAPESTLKTALELMKKYDIYQLPVMEDGSVIGSVVEDSLIELMMMGKDLDEIFTREIMDEPFPEVEHDAPIDELASIITEEEQKAVLVNDQKGNLDLLTKYDILHAMQS